MKKIVTTNNIDEADLNIILAESLIDEDNNFYDFTFGMALKEECGPEPLLYCEYVVDSLDGESRLTFFRGWTASKVIYNVVGIGVPDTLLASVHRNPPNA